MSTATLPTETPPIPLSADQWRGLARLGELVLILDRALDGPMGAVSVDYLAEIMTLAPSHTLAAVREVLDLLVEWHEKGMLSQIRDFGDMVSSLLSQENINAVSLAALAKARRNGIPHTMRTLAHELGDAAKSSTVGLGGFGGLMRLMRDKDVQAGLRLMGTMAGKVQELLHSDEGHATPSPQH